MRVDPFKIQDIIDNVWYIFNNNGMPINTREYPNKDFWVISDTHFNHRKIQEYCNRPDGWQDLIIENWNKLITKDDIVLHLGDFAFGNKEQVSIIREQLNGEIFLIRGNHDRHSKKWYEDIEINVISPFMVNSEGDINIYFTHRRIKEEMFYGINIHGHMHQMSPFIGTENDGIFVNLSVEETNYKPKKFSKILMRIKMVGNILKDINITYDGNTPYINSEDIPEEYIEEFKNWMRGCTVPIVEGVESAFYKWDWDMWCNRKFK